MNETQQKIEKIKALLDKLEVELAEARKILKGEKNG